MNEGGGNGDYIGKGIDKVETPNDAMGRPKSHNSEEKSNVLNGEENPDRPLDRGEAVGREGNVLIAGEKNQQSDKTQSNGWINHTGLKVGMTAGSTVGMALQAGRAVSRSSFGRSAKVAGPIATILIVLGICIMGLMTSATFLVESLIPNIHRVKDTLDIAATVRTREIISGIMRGEYTKGGLFEKLSDKITGILENSGASVKTVGDQQVIEVAEGNGKTVTVTGDNLQTLVAENNSVYEMEHTINSGSAPYSYDSMAEGPLYKDRLNVESRNNFADAEKAEDVDEVMSAAFGEATGEMKLEADQAESKKETIEDSSRDKTVTQDVVETSRDSVSVTSRDDLQAATDKMINEGMEFSGIVSKAAKGICLVYSTAMTINRMIKAYEAAQVVAMGLRVFEAIQRMQAGDGGDEVLAVFINNLTRPTTTEFELAEGEFTTITTSAIGSSAIAPFYGGAKLTDNDPIVQSFVTSSNQFRKIADSMEGGKGYKACTGANLMASIADLFGDLATLGATRLVGLVVNVAISTAIGMAISAIMSIMVPKVVNALGRDFSNLLEGAPAGGMLAWFADIVIPENEKLAGMSVGTKESQAAYIQRKTEIIAERARYYRDTLSPFDASSEYTFMGTLMASLTRASLNTSSIVGRVGNIASVVGSSLVALTPASHAADAIDEIVSTGNYPEITQLVNDGKERFATAFGEPYYIPDFSTAGKSIEDIMWYWDAKGCFEEPYDPVSNPNPSVRMNGTGIASAKNPIILAIKEGRNVFNDTTLAAYANGDSNLADEFVLSDVTSSQKNELALGIEEKLFRGAPLGVVDAEIEAKYRPLDTGSSFWDNFIGAIPAIGSFVDTFNNVDVLAHMSNILGSRYHDGSLLNRMFEAYAMTQRIGEVLGFFKKAQTTAYIDKYVEEHPLDKTLVGRIARNSGLSREQVITAFKQINALSFIADYHPDGLGPLFYEKPVARMAFKPSSGVQGQPAGIVYYAYVPAQRRIQSTTA